MQDFISVLDFRVINLSFFTPVPPCLDYYLLAVSFEVKKCEASNFVLFFGDCFGYSGFLASI
jgi:hypothetical protein